MPDEERTSWWVAADGALPPARPGTRHVKLLRHGTVVADDDLRRTVDRRFHWPMIVLALAILPMLIIEFMQPPSGWMQIALKIGFAVIWLAFLIEFIVKVAIAESRVEYVRRNWLDVVIIAVPVLRPLQANAGLLRTTRAFKLRGIAMKFLRYMITIVVGMEATDRILERIGMRREEGLKDPSRMTRYQLMDEVRSRRRAIRGWESWYDAHLAWLRDQHASMDPNQPPPDEFPPSVVDDLRDPGDLNSTH